MSCGVKIMLNEFKCTYVIEKSTYLDLARAAKNAILSIVTCHEVQYGNA